MSHQKARRGFTLIEVLVVVLIIGILAAIALPMYNKAVLRSRFNALMPIVKAMNDSNEAYYLEHGSYASNPQDLPVQGQSSYPTETELELGPHMDYAYVLASNRDARNNYIMYQKHSENYPGEIHCEAVTGDDLAEYICESAGGTQNLGTTLTEGYTTYVLSGEGMGFPPGYNALFERVDCTGAEALGFTCTQTVDEENNTATKKICTWTGQGIGHYICRTKTYNEDGSYTSVTCNTHSGTSQCNSAENWSSATYDANGNKISTRRCSTLTAGICTAYKASGSSDYTYDANGNQLTHRTCSSVDSSGNCTAYSGGYNYTYDANGNMLTKRNCSSVDSSGNCTAYSSYSNIDYTSYDANGNKLTERWCVSVDNSGTCTAYNTTYEYTYDANGNMLTKNRIGSYSWYYTYDANGNMLTNRMCETTNADGSCKSYRNGYNHYDYTYDADGRKLSQRTCTEVNSDGGCKSYSSYSENYDYAYNGNIQTVKKCGTMNADGSCSTYSNIGSSESEVAMRMYDDNDDELISVGCSTSSNDFNSVTGECNSYALHGNGASIIAN